MCMFFAGESCYSKELGIIQGIKSSRIDFHTQLKSIDNTLVLVGIYARSKNRKVVEWD